MSRTRKSRSLEARYVGRRTSSGAVVFVTDADRTSTLPQRQDLVNHSPDGFEWGYGGSGPAQLALAILADYLGDDQRALHIYQDFKWLVIATIPREQWELTGRDIEDAITRVTVKQFQSEGGAA